MNRVLLVSLGLLVVFAYADARNVDALKTLQARTPDPGFWDLFTDQILPAWLLVWVVALSSLGVVWWLVTHDWSEALALVLVPTLLLAAGVEDVLYFAFSADTLSDTVGCYANTIPLTNAVRWLRSHPCATPSDLLLSSGVGLLLALVLYRFLQRWF